MNPYRVHLGKNSVFMGCAIVSNEETELSGDFISFLVIQLRNSELSKNVIQSKSKTA